MTDYDRIPDAAELASAAAELAAWLIERVEAQELETALLKRRLGFATQLSQLIEHTVRNYRIRHRDAPEPPEGVHLMQQLLAHHAGSDQLMKAVGEAFVPYRRLFTAPTR